MKKPLFVVLAALALTAPLTGFAGPDESQRRIFQQTQEAQKKLGEAKGAPVGEQRAKLMQEHMKLMQDAMKQMQAAKPASNLSSQQMREWIDEHIKLMDQMMSQMMEDQQLMMGGGMMGGAGMMGDSGKKATTK
jgi:hypothetical protein